MLLKRHFKEPAAEGRPRDLDHIQVIHTGVDAEQHFSKRMVDKGVAEGWITLGGGKLTLHAKPEDLEYTILRPPGRWCVHCGVKLEDDQSGEAARAHVAAHHAGVASPDPRYPAGYAYPTHYKVTLRADQHSRLKKGD